MTTRQLKDKVNYIGPTFKGRFLVQIIYRNEHFKCYSTNTLAKDAIVTQEYSYYTERQALQSLYDECKQANNLR